MASIDCVDVVQENENENGNVVADDNDNFNGNENDEAGSSTDTSTRSPSLFQRLRRYSFLSSAAIRTIINFNLFCCLIDPSSEDSQSTIKVLYIDAVVCRELNPSNKSIMTFVAVSFSFIFTHSFSYPIINYHNIINTTIIYNAISQSVTTVDVSEIQFKAKNNTQ